ncbi:MAG: transcriptional repressor LexA [Candidatus Sumerlaeia bacterium]
MAEQYLTKKQRQMLDFIQAFIEKRQYSPSLEEICEGMGLSSLATVHAHLKNLEEKKMIRRSWNRSRSIELVEAPRRRRGTVELPLLGRVAAGVPIEAVEVRETVEAPEEFARGKETFVLQVQGDSMIEEQIRDGDMVIVERRETAQNGETVVALVDGESATVKKFYKEKNGKVRLQPANASMKPIMIQAKRCQIQGVVIGLLRRY